jgi:hypothetical protein
VGCKRGLPGSAEFYNFFQHINGAAVDIQKKQTGLI